ncbi:hypothetical protein SEA_DELIAN_42 [Gordonia phage Delian]|uniref:hypothetical protein n=1 Tax=Gordonia phage CaptainKirk2 TaxID=1887643 RepID=UPI00084F4A05|nr:hypothetical protein BIZ76_gp39 [Gordonia phage CaptainKirk2]AOE43982.1 hypothetical protein SEA_CAPTAINKIRK2_39 [Gordonia phage CaptainKirk2]QGH77962.1 hypothetical protein SEA_DELIAN_42 [Gordonia phage Delian]
MDDQKRAEKERKKAEAKASREVMASLKLREQMTLKMGFGGLISNGVSIGFGRNSDQWYALAGCHATMRYGAIESHQSIGRMAAGHAVAGWKGAAVGGVMGETAQNIYVDITWPNGYTITGMDTGEADAAKFIELVNRLSQRPN